MLHRIKAALSAGTLALALLTATAVAPTPAEAANLADIQGRGTVRIGVLTGAPPMGMIDSQGNPTGYDVDVANLVGTYLGLPVQLVPLTPPARIPALQTGQVDFLVATLDPELTGEVLAVMEKLARDGMTMLLVTHEMGFARRVANTTVFMHQGLIHESGPSREIFERPKTPEMAQFIKAGIK